MRTLLFIIFFISLNYSGDCQTFLNTFKKHRLEKADTLSNQKTRKKIKSYIKSQIIELDTIFQSYKAKTNFDFNEADTLFLIYDTPVESPFTSHVIIWSGKDTMSYRQGFETIKPFEYKRKITYEPFLPKLENPTGFKVVTERDSLVTLVSKKDFTIISHLGDNQGIIGGSYFSIYVAYKNNGRYVIESYFPKQFIIQDTYREE